MPYKEVQIYTINNGNHQIIFIWKVTQSDLYFQKSVCQKCAELSRIIISLKTTAIILMGHGEIPIGHPSRVIL